MKKLLLFLLIPMPLVAQNYLWNGNSVHEYSQARERLMNDTLLDANDVAAKRLKNLPEARNKQVIW
ncbi:hypothetical protein IMQ36_13500 [Providencia rettgeri]|nr:hypothetical protein [Providencia rettgeri]QPE16188.1 hypothetical protein IMQ36_13500 [Providencia rettgeri]